MPLFEYTGDDSRTYPSLGIEAKPGVTAELDEAPSDGRWSLAPAAKPVAKDGAANA